MNRRSSVGTGFRLTIKDKDILVSYLHKILEYNLLTLNLDDMGKQKDIWFDLQPPQRKSMVMHAKEYGLETVFKDHHRPAIILADYPNDSGYPNDSADLESLKGYRINLNLGRSWVERGVPDFGDTVIYSGHPAYPTLRAWAKNYTDIKRDVIDAKYFLSTIAYGSNSVGQLARLIPDLFHYLPERYTNTASEYKRKPPIARDVRVIRDMDGDAFGEKLANLNHRLSLGALVRPTLERGDYTFPPTGEKL